MYEIDWRLRKLINRGNIEKKFQAKLAGMDLKIPSIEAEKPIEVTEEQESIMSEAIERAKLRKAREYGK